VGHERKTTTVVMVAGRSLRRIVAFTARFLVVSAVVLLLFCGVGPRTGRYRVLTVLSGSMRPTLPIGGLLVITPESAGSVRPGQVITFDRPLPDHEVVTHRVIAVEYEHGHPVVRTQGDFNDSADPWRAELTSPTVWRTRAVIPGAGTALAAVRAPWLKRITMLVVPFLLAATWLVQIWRPSTPAEPEPARGWQPV
jgi:signal peptidase